MTRVEVPTGPIVGADPRAGTIGVDPYRETVDAVQSDEVREETYRLEREHAAGEAERRKQRALAQIMAVQGCDLASAGAILERVEAKRTADARTWKERKRDLLKMKRRA